MVNRSPISKKKKRHFNLKRNPFYAEKGGQVGDSGEIFCSDGTFVVSHTTSPKAGIVIHHGEVSQGRLCPAQAVTAQVHCLRRKISATTTRAVIFT